MAKASIHFRPVKANSQAHNERLVNLDYNFPDLVKNNQSWKIADIAEKEKQIEAYCKKVSGRKLQKNAEPIREAVVNLNPHHTLEDLQQLAQVLQEEKGIECFQIHIHRDEGKFQEEINHHAHMLFSWQDKKTGKTLKLNKTDLSQIQTIVAKTLSMERGQLRVNSNRERLEPIEFKRQQEELRLQKLQSQIAELEQKKNTAASAYRSAAERHRAAEQENRRIGEAKTSDFEARIKQLAIEGIPNPEKWSEIEENELNSAIKLQRQDIEKQQSLIADIKREIEEYERDREFVEAWNTFKRLEAEHNRLESEISKLEK